MISSIARFKNFSERVPILPEGRIPFLPPHEGGEFVETFMVCGLSDEQAFINVQARKVGDVASLVWHAFVVQHLGLDRQPEEVLHAPPEDCLTQLLRELVGHNLHAAVGLESLHDLRPDPGPFLSPGLECGRQVHLRQHLARS